MATATKPRTQRPGRRHVDRPKAANGDGSIYEDRARGVWRAVVVLPNGRRLSRRTKTGDRNEAVALLAALHTEAAEHGPRPTPGTRQAWTVSAWFDYWRASVVADRKGRHGTGLSRSSKRREDWLAADIRAMFGTTPLRQLTAEDVERWLGARSMGVDVARRSWGVDACTQARNLLARALDEAVGRKHVADNVARRAGIPAWANEADARFAMTEDDAAKVYRAAVGSAKASAHVVGLMLATGMRPGEAIRVQWGDVDRAARTLTIPKAKTDTGLRTIALNPNAWAVIAARLSAAGLGARDDAAYVFPGDLSAHVSHYALIDELARICEAEDVTVGADDPTYTPRVPRPHELRHTVASILIDADVSPQQVADMLGDRIETILRTYRHKLRPVAGDVAAAPLMAVYGAAS